MEFTLSPRKSVKFAEDSKLCDIFFYSFPCDECDYESRSKNSLENHIKTTHESADKLHTLILSVGYLVMAYIVLVVSYYAQHKQEDNINEGVTC